MANFTSSLTDSLDYKDVFIVPQYSDITSRKEVDVSAKLKEINLSNKVAGEIDIRVPIMNANMDTVSGEDISVAISNAGGLATLHRFQTVDEACEEYKRVQARLTTNNPVFVSIGVNRDSKVRAQRLYKVGARHMVIDIAHGHSAQMKEMIEWIRSHLPGTYIMAGNVASEDAVLDLVKWGAHAVKCGIGPGAVCLTKNVTGVTVPQFSCVIECVKGKKSLQAVGKDVTIVADGGCREIGDICKAIGAGADFVMTGKLFASCIEAPGKGVYRGSASQEVQAKYRTDKEYVPTPEGMSTIIEFTGDRAADVVEHIAGGLRSAYSYTGTRNTPGYKSKVKFGIRR